MPRPIPADCLGYRLTGAQLKKIGDIENICDFFNK